MIANCIVEDDGVTPLSPSDVSSSSSVSDRVRVSWGCELSGAQRTAVFEVDDLLENQLFIKTICLSAEASDEMHLVAVCDIVGGSKLVPIATLRHSMPTVSFPGLELTPPVTFKLCSGQGPIYISAQHVTFGPDETAEEEGESF